MLKVEDVFPPDALEKADSLLSARSYVLANKELDGLLESPDTRSNIRLYISTLLYKANAYRRLDGLSYADAIPILEEALALAKENLETDDILLARTYFNLGRFNHQDYNFFKARAIIDTSMVLYERSRGIDQDLYEDLIDYKYYTYSYSNGSTDTLLKYVDLRYQRELAMEEQDPFEILYILQDFPDMYSDIGDYEKALTYAIQGYKYAKENKAYVLNTRGGFEVYANSFVNLMEVLIKRQDYEEALKTARKVLQAIEEEGIAIENYVEYYAVLVDMGTLYNRMGQYDLALAHLKDALEIGTETPVKAIFYGKILVSIADCLKNLGRTEESEQYFMQGLQTLKEYIEMPSTDYHQPYDDFGDFYVQNDRFNLALTKYDSALINSLPLNRNPWYEFPNDTTQDLSLAQISTIARKASLFDKVSTDSLQKEELYKHGLSYAENVHQILVNRRKEFSATEGKLFLSEEFRFVYESAIDFAYELYMQTGDEAYFLEGLKFARLSKSILFLEQSAEYEKVNNNIVDRSLKLNFSEYKKKLDQLESGFYGLIDDDVTSDSIFVLNDSLSAIRTKLDAILDTIDQDLVKANWSDIEEVFTNNLYRINEQKGQVQVEYFYGEQYIYTIAYGKEKRVFNKIELNEEFEQSLLEVIRQVTSPPDINNFNQDRKLFASSSYQLYNTLLEPVLEQIEGVEELVIIPDQGLSRLPFEVLISEHNREVSFENMEFLIKSYEIRYELSSLLENQKRTNESVNGILGLGYAANNSINETGFLGLPGTEQEINFLKASYQGTFINSASKEQFISLANGFDILHLAVHGSSDTLNKYDSRLIFSSGAEHELKTSDLYLAGLNARLAILSACESGVGMMNVGEGTFSIARGFALSGVPSVVMSLWKVNDKITSKLMESMYHHFIDEGQSINTSLELAKRDYLQNADAYFSHPYYWASFVHLGEDIAFNEKSGVQQLFLLLLLVPAILGYYWAKKRKRNN